MLGCLGMPSQPFMCHALTRFIQFYLVCPYATLISVSLVRNLMYTYLGVSISLVSPPQLTNKQVSTFLRDIPDFSSSLLSYLGIRNQINANILCLWGQFRNEDSFVFSRVNSGLVKLNFKSLYKFSHVSTILVWV